MPIDHPTGFGYFFLAGGLLGLAGGGEQVIKQLALWRRAVRVEAEVVSVRAETSLDDNGAETTLHWPTVSFTAGEARVQTELVAGRSGSKPFRRGQRLTVFYDPRNSKSAALRRRDWPGGILVTLLAAVSAAIGLTLLRI